MGSNAVDRVRNQQIPSKPIELDVLGTLVSILHFLCQVHPLLNRGSIHFRKLDRGFSLFSNFAGIRLT
jgi:hypothetical protein